MSWMSPSYIVQDDFNTSWTPLARRYSLLLYREVGWDSEQTNGRPVLFIPGNAGSSHQVRSIASSAARQIYTTPHVRSTDIPANVEPLDLYAGPSTFDLEFNEDLSALHGPTLQTQTAYVQAALKYIISKYPGKHDLQVTLLGHSMGGIVALNALVSPHHRSLVRAVITMSSPHSLPPARLDRDIEQVFDNSIGVLWKIPANGSAIENPPVLALCGGATDNMIPMESCMLPPPPVGANHDSALYRRTIFTSGLDGTWTGVGHREMVWCHQVRWRVARASLELAVAEPSARGPILDRWFAGGVNLNPSRPRLPASHSPPEHISDGYLSRSSLPVGTSVFHFPIQSLGSRLVILLSSGRILGVSPEKDVATEVEVDLCQPRESSNVVCAPINSGSTRLIPNPSLKGLFPVPGEGTDESEGVVVWESDVTTTSEGYFSVTVSSKREGGSWLVARLEQSDSLEFATGKLAPFFGSTEIKLPETKSLIRRIWIPNLISNAMVVYRATFNHEGDCTNPLLTPVLAHTSSEIESHFHRTLPPAQNPVLHTHNSGPFIGTKYGLNITVYTSGECQVNAIQFHVDWRISFGRVASRLWAGVFAWAIATVAAMNALAWHEWNENKQFITPFESFEQITKRLAAPALAGVTILSTLPLLRSFLLGINGESVFSILAPICLALAIMTVGCSCYVLSVFQWICSGLYNLLHAVGLATDLDNRRPPFTRSFMVFHLFVGALVIVFIPYQVAYLVAFILHLWDCSTSRVHLARQGLTKPTRLHLLSSYGQASHLLLTMFWMLPLITPVLVVWARTLVTAGLTTPFDGDHNILKVMFVVMSVELRVLDAPSKRAGPLLSRVLINDRLPVFASLPTPLFCLILTLSIFNMRSAFVALLSLIASAAAYQVTYPGAADKWYAGTVTNKFDWTRVNTDADSFTLVLTNEDRSLLPVNNQQLIATVPGSAGSIDVPAPSGGFPVGKGFRVNMVKSPTELTTILAQSPEFEIVAGTGTSSTSVTATSVTSRSTVIISPTTGTTTPTSTSGDLNPTNSPASNNGAMSIVARASPVVIAGALAAAFMA
ncbi:PGAP1-like protein, partial [Rhizoctonia solani]